MATTRAARLPRAWVRVWAWILGALAFFAPWALLGLSPKPATAAGVATPTPQPEPKPKRVIHRVVRRVIIEQAPPIQVPSSVTYVGGSGGGGGGWSGSAGGGGGSSGGGGGSVSPPVTSTRGS